MIRSRLHITLMLIGFLSFEVLAQCTNDFYQLEEGRAWEYTSYNKRGKKQGRQYQEVRNLDQTASGFEATIYTKVYDKKDKVITEGEFDMACNDGIVTFDIEQMIPAGTLDAFKQMEMEMEADQLEWPSALSVGQNLDDGYLKMSAKGPLPMNVNMEITNRVVKAKEQLTVPAGTYDAFKVTYDSELKASMIKQNFSVVQYVAEGVGVVKTENYDKKGQLSGYSVLTRYE